MLSSAAGVVAHAGSPLAPHDLWRAWDPAALGAVAVAGGVVVMAQRRHRPSRGPRVAAAAAVLVVALAVASPVDALAGELVSVHMVQHVLLVAVAAPLLAAAAPWRSVLRALPRRVRSRLVRTGRRAPVASGARLARHPVAVWLVHAGALWAWHASAAYEAAVANEVVHVAEHAVFLGTAVLFWVLVVGTRRHRLAAPAGALLVFTMALQTTILSALMTFAPTPWYTTYAGSAVRWGLDPLTDQQLAGLLMWVPMGLLYVAIAVALLVAWLARDVADAERGASLTVAAVP